MDGIHSKLDEVHSLIPESMLMVLRLPKEVMNTPALRNTYEILKKGLAACRNFGRNFDIQRTVHRDIFL